MAKTATGCRKIILKWIGRRSCAVTELFSFRVVLPAGGDFFARPYLTLCFVPGSMFYFPALFLRPNNRLDTNANSRARAVREMYRQFMFRRL